MVSISKMASQNMAKPIRTDGSTVTISKTASEIQHCRVFFINVWGHFNCLVRYMLIFQSGPLIN